MSSVASQNRFAYLGNDDDGDEKPIVPVKTVEKAPSRTTKRNAEPQAPQPSVRGSATGRRGGLRGNEAAFRDRAAGSDRNHGRSTDETPREGARGGYGARVRGGRGSRRPRELDDRHPSRAGGHGGSDKQAAHSWGANEGTAELKDEQAGEAMAQSEKKEAQADDQAPDEATEAEDKSVSYADYLAQQAEKKLSLEASFKVREANEGSKLDKKWANAKALEKNDDEEYVSGMGGKTKRERERKTKQTIDFDPRFVEPERGHGPGRGGGARGGARGARGGRGADRGGRGASHRGGGGRESAAPINTNDKAAFPSLGGGN